MSQADSEGPGTVKGEDVCALVWQLTQEPSAFLPSFPPLTQEIKIV